MVTDKQAYLITDESEARNMRVLQADNNVTKHSYTSSTTRVSETTTVKTVYKAFLVVYYKLITPPSVLPTKSLNFILMDLH